MNSLISSPLLPGAHLRVDGVSLAFADRRVLTDVSFVVSANERVGIIGENGSGKSTLLRIIAGLLPPDSGAVTVNATAGLTPSIGLLHQDAPFTPGDSIAQALESAVAPARDVLAAMDRHAAQMAADPDDQDAAARYAQTLDDAERLEAWDVDARIAAMLAGLGLDDLPTDRLTSEISGGQRARLSLAWLLLSAPDVLLLDEPTNHLDDHATAYLRSILLAWRGPVLFASHDRAFLDETVTSLIDLDPAPVPHAVAGPLTADGPGSGIGITRFTGSYSDYLAARNQAHLRWETQYRDEQAELKRLWASVRDNHVVGHENWKPRTEVRGAAKFYSDRNAAVVSRRVNDARSRLDDLEQRQIRRPPAGLRFGGLTAGLELRNRREFSGPVLAASEVAVSGRLESVSLTVSATEKWLVTGPNGSGKSTLLEVLAGQLDPTGGSVNAPAGLRIGMLSQDVDLPDPFERGDQRSVRQAYQDLLGAELAEQAPLSRFGLIAGRDENRPLLALSLGQQRRLALAVLLADPPDVLLLDEPTNHLSLLLVTELEAAIPGYPGTVVVASHDRWLRRNWTGQRFEMAADGDSPV
ncbi:MAG: ABC-F family ATP-binding cassette domain-containing protein [Propionibacterium sp.]|nr:ABC-F family ATP-binding cassette domain-containing protein [Propionibacterium sp.]